MPISLQQVFKDKDFYQLPKEERYKVISQVDSNFGQLPMEEQNKAYLGLENKFRVVPQKGTTKTELPFEAKHPSATALGRTALEFVPYARFLDPETRKDFVQKSIQSPWKATADMLLSDMLPTAGLGALAKVAGKVPKAIEAGLKFTPLAKRLSLAEQAINKGIAGAGKVATGQVAKKTLIPEERTSIINQLGKNTETRFGKVKDLSDEDLLRVKMEAPKQPWEMSRGEFEKQAIYRGVGVDNKKTPNTFWTDRFGKAKSFSTRPTAGGQGEIKIGFKNDLPELWQGDKKVSPDEWFKTTGEVTGDIPERVSIPSHIDDPHKYIVQQAISEGKPVPPEVLKDYPELQAPKQHSFEPTEPQVGKTTRERGFVTSVKEQFPVMEERVSGQYIPRSTDNLSIKASNLIKDDIDKAENLARMGTDDNAVATSSELIKHYVEKATTSPSNKGLFLDKAAEIAHITAQKLTESGRAVQAASILGRLTPEGQLRFAARTINRFNETAPLGKKIPNLTSDQTKNILTRSKKIESMPDGRDKAREFFKLQEDIAKLVPTPMYKKIINVWKAGLLTGIKTSGLNTFSNLFHGVTETVKDVPASAVDSVASLFTGKRTLGLTTKGTGKGTIEGFGKGWDYLKTGFDERNIRAKLDTKKINFGEGKFAKAMQAYEEGIFRILGAEDQPFYYGAKARSLQSQAIVQAKNKGLKGNEAKKFIENATQNPTDDMMKYATIDAETAVFQNETQLGKAGKSLQNVFGGTGEFVVPFARTPAAVAMQVVNYSPIGIAKTIVQNAGRGKFDQRLFSQGLGRGLTGTGVIATGTALYNSGLINLGRPQTEREKKLWELEGKKENSIKINGKWRSANVLGPAGNLLLVGGYFQRELDKSGSPTKAIVQAVGGGAKSFSEQTFLKGMSATIDTLSDPERSGEYFVSNLAGSTVPTIVADIARANDETERRTESVSQGIKARVPGLRNTLEPKVNVFGQDVSRYGGNILEVMIDPTRPSKIRNDVVVDELRKLNKKGFKVTPTLLGSREGYKSLTPEQNTQLWRTSGRLTYNSIFNDISEKDYKNLSDEDKAKVIEARTKYSKDLARASMINEILQSAKTPEEKKQKLEGLYQEKFINQDVLEIYNELNQ